MKCSPAEFSHGLVSGSPLKTVGATYSVEKDRATGQEFIRFESSFTHDGEQAILLGESWHGTLDLHDNVGPYSQMGRFKNYVSKKRKP